MKMEHILLDSSVVVNGKYCLFYGKFRFNLLAGSHSLFLRQKLIIVLDKKSKLKNPTAVHETNCFKYYLNLKMENVNDRNAKHVPCPCQPC